MSAEARLIEGGSKLALLTEEQRFASIVAAQTPDVTKWLKRVRKESGAKLRYILVAEAHKSGLPHYHMLVHEQVGGGQVGERTLRKQWAMGFSKWNLVTDKAPARYVCKYLTKAAAARVRASLNYGRI